jgi:DNA mismatch endonuclease Vsr
MVYRKGISFATSAIVRGRMQQQRRRDTKPELLFREQAHRLGLRYRLDCRPLPGMRRRADLVFRSARVAVFVDGCFWHGCRRHCRWPNVNRDGGDRRSNGTGAAIMIPTYGSRKPAGPLSGCGHMTSQIRRPAVSPSWYGEDPASR